MRILLSRSLISVLIFTAVYLTYNYHSVTTRDPGSFFFNPRVAYRPEYSHFRSQEAEAFIATAADLRKSSKARDAQKKLCVGIPSVARRGADYLQTAVGSLLDGLALEERDEIYLVVLIPHSDPTIHPAYTEQWLPALADGVLTYDVDAPQLQHIVEMEKEGGLFREKGLYDYSYLLKECYKQGTPYIAVFEDDIVAMDGWYHRTMAAIDEAERLSALKKASPDFLYLRLFYTEEFLGFNSEDWKTYLFSSAIFVSLPVAFLAGLRRLVLAATAYRIITNRTIFATFTVSVALVIAFFLLGRVTVLPLPAGVNEMSKYGCCAQGFVFPREKAMTLVRWFEAKRIGFVDVLTEEYADLHGELRWAITPSVIQHIGRKSSKIDDYGPASKHGLSVAEKIWNFGFEKHRPEDLRREHQKVIEQRRKET